VTVRDDILEFLRAPADFSATVRDPEVWAAGLTDFAKPSILQREDRPLRAAQEAAWLGLAHSRAGLVLGPPGTGKTHLLSWLIAAYALSRQASGLTARTFVSAFTRNAAANVLEGVVKRQAIHDPDAPPPLYFGAPPAGGIAAGITVLGRGDEAEVFRQIATGRVVVGGTIWSLYRLLSHPDAPGGGGRTAPLFDLVCIDEASQLVLGQGLMALAGMAPGCRVVVAGDDRQLPPIRAARATPQTGRDLGGSLYAFLKSAGVREFRLEETFRLNGPLTEFARDQFYDETYVSAAPDQRLSLAANWRDGLDAIARAALDPEFPIVVLLHDGPSASTSNPFEAALAARLAEALSERVLDAAGDALTLQAFWTDGLAVVSPHRAQNAAIRAALPPRLKTAAFVETVDRIQGKERDAVILSYCVADAEFALAEGEFIFSSERLNVATTRARSKLIVLISRRLVDVAPADQEIVDKVEILRRFVFDCTSQGRILADGPNGRTITIEVLTKGFEGGEATLDVTTEETPVESGLAFTEDLERVLAGIRDVSTRDGFGSAMLSKVRKALAMPHEPFDEARRLHLLGWISLQHRAGKFGPFWTARPFEAPRRVYPVDEAEVRNRLPNIVRDARSGKYAFYDQVRDRFGWMSAGGQDELLPLLHRLEAEGVLHLRPVNDSLTVEMASIAASADTDAPAPAPVLLDDDFVLLNALESFEAHRINFGVFDGWTSVVELADRANLTLEGATEALSRLEQNGHLMLIEGNRLRSRMAQLARELRHVKQRFRSDDAARRPYLARHVKVELRNRDKPKRDLPLADVFEAASAGRDPGLQQALVGLQQTLERMWGPTAALAGFQSRGLSMILDGWQARGPANLAIAADTGSGKTEAAVLPIIAAAMADHLAGVKGVRAILAYPRIRLAANQAQRLAEYLAACAETPGLPLLTLGLQVGAVPQSFDALHPERNADWKPAGPDSFVFPFFNCPRCGGILTLRVAQGVEGADALVCSEGDWRYDGWVGSKEALKARPPALFLPTTDSLHQWMHNPAYGRLFGDDPGFAAPRLLLADEIHLYTHIHGSQVGWALRRLAGRVAENAGPETAPMVNVGMSATIGDPAAAWGRLIGQPSVEVIRPTPEETETNPRGREYFYFIQPEVESRGSDISGSSTTIQSLMCLGHGVRRRTGRDGGFRSLVFFDSIDKMRRLHGAYVDAEEGLELAAYRTIDYGDDPRGEPQRKCCRDPIGCDRFTDGECWWFAATDQRQRGAQGSLPPGQPLRVARSPIYSGTSSEAEALVKGADVVFATSSLEVGYDDPDITLVYQHYAPLNMASFVQRKGRGGRGADDRPTTAVTLSLYSPRDSWWFRRPHEMVSPAGFDAPLNPDNTFVKRGQALTAMLDGLARWERRNGMSAFGPGGQVRAPALEDARRLAETVLGAEVWSIFDATDAGAFLGSALAAAPAGDLDLPRLRERLAWAPNALFDSINLPTVNVIGPEVLGGARQDVSLALATVAPGNATRRYNAASLHWRTPWAGQGPWFASDDYEVADYQSLALTTEAVLEQLPLEARPDLAGLATSLCRPTQVRLDKVGRMAGSHWTPDTGYRPGLPAPVGPLTDGREPLGHESRGSLRGFVLVDAEPGAGAVLEPGLSGATAALYTGDALGRQGAGLRAARVYWGADVTLKFDDREVEPVALSQTFIHPETRQPQLHGFQVETEGLRLAFDSTALDAFVEGHDLKTTAEDRLWWRRQAVRFAVESQGRSAGLNSYEAERGAQLIAALTETPELKARLLRTTRFWATDRLEALFEEARLHAFAHHPLMTATRVQRAAEAFSSDAMRTVVIAVLKDSDDPEAGKRHLRSMVLHGLAIRLKHLVAHVGQGDDRRLLAHVRLPVQFGDTDDVITVCEAGAHGDGTIRAVADAWDRVLALWNEGFAAFCPNAEEDAAVERFWTLASSHEAWRALDRRDPRRMAEIGAAIGRSGSPPPSAVLRILFDVEAVSAEPMALYDLACEIRAVQAGLRERLGRKPHDWEIAGASVLEAQSGAAPVLARLYAAYQTLDDLGDGGFSAEARLADQVNRLAAPLCVDGCRACVHQSSDLMSDTLVQSSVSRTAVAAFLGG